MLRVHVLGRTFTALKSMSGLVDDVRTYYGENAGKFAIPDLMAEKC